jgi:hypothetical protein
VATGAGLTPFIPAFPPGFRAGVAHIVIVISSAEFHDVADYGGAVTGAHSFASALNALRGQNVKVIGLAVPSGGGATNPALQQLSAYAEGTGAMLTPTQPGNPGACPTGMGGALVAPAPSGLCTLTFQTSPTGGSVSLSALVLAVRALAM